MDKTIKNRLDFFGMFFPPVRIENQYTKNQSNNNPRKEYKKQFIHNTYSPPLSHVPMMRNIANKMNPTITTGQENFSGAAMLAIIKVMKTAWAKLRKTLAKPSLCRRLNFINLIIGKIKDFVNPAHYFFKKCFNKAYHTPRIMGGVKYFGMKKVACPLFRSAVICVCLLLINLSTYQPINCLYAQEIDIKTKIKELKHKDPKVRITAIQSLGKVQNEEVVRVLTDAYKKEKDAYLRMQIVDTLSINQSTSALAGVISALDDPNPQVRQSAVIALGYYGDNEKIASALSTLFANEKEEAVKFSIVNTLGQQKNKSAVSGLGKALDKKNDKRMRLFAVSNLEKIQTKEVFAELEKNKEDPDPEIKEKVNKILEKKK